MRYWDSSALVPLFVEEESSAEMRRLATERRAMVSWCGSIVEVTSSIERRAGGHGFELRSRAIRRMDEGFSRMTLVTNALMVIDRARIILARHRLRAADALQLGAALVVREDDPSAVEFVSLDVRLCEAASREGFVVLPAGE